MTHWEQHKSVLEHNVNNSLIDDFTFWNFYFELTIDIRALRVRWTQINIPFTFIYIFTIRSSMVIELGFLIARFACTTIWSLDKFIASECLQLDKSSQTQHLICSISLYNMLHVKFLPSIFGEHITDISNEQSLPSRTTISAGS